MAVELSGDDDGLLDDLAALRPDQTDVFARSLQVQVRRSLVGATGEPFSFGRFTVLGPLGGGGMGVVFVAYDPDLDRKIALKVLHNRGERGRREVLREGRALARLKHPNIVAVYEVGVLDDRVFVAMEYVEGSNLRTWLREPRSLTAILARLVEAGRGLAAAHAVELVHRDFKPENLVIDVQGHARVIDFGLARPVETPEVDRPVAGALETTASVHGGTPAYMAPERLAGAAGDRRSDQYSFCVTCWEALFGVRPTGERVDATTPRASSGRGVPGWLRRVIERGLAPEPAKRWPSMTALLAALERGRTRARLWRVAALLVGVAALVVAAEGLRRREVAQRVAACRAAGAEIEAAWNDDARQRLRASFAGTGVSEARQTADKVVPRLDEQVDAWKRARTGACLNADVHARWSAELLGRAVFCLEDRQLELESLVTELGRADATVVREAVSAVASLKTPDACMDEGLLLRQPAPPERRHPALEEVRVELARASSLGLAGNYKAALEAATRARVRAETALDWPPLWAAARTEEAGYLEQTGAYEQAEAGNTEAYFAAARVGAWSVAAEAATQLIMATCRRGRYEEARAWARHAELAIAHAGDWSGLTEAWRLNDLAIVLVRTGAYAEARVLHERALAIRERALGPDHPDVAESLNHLALVHHSTGAYAEARALHERVLAIWEQTLGPDHPHVAASLNNLAIVHEATGGFTEALALHERALAVRERTLGAEHPETAATLGNLANVQLTLGAYAEARALYERTLAIQEKVLGREHLEIATTLGNLSVLHYASESYAEARALGERALAIRERALGPDHPDVAISLINLANVLEDTGAHAEARRLYGRALAIREKTLGPDHPEVAASLSLLGIVNLDAKRPADALPLLERAVAILDAHDGVQPGEFEAHQALAYALVAAHGDRARALAEARRARDGFREAGEVQAEALAEIERWLVEHAGDK